MPLLRGVCLAGLLVIVGATWADSDAEGCQRNEMAKPVEVVLLGCGLVGKAVLRMLV